MSYSSLQIKQLKDQLLQDNGKLVVRFNGKAMTLPDDTFSVWDGYSLLRLITARGLFVMGITQEPAIENPIACTEQYLVLTKAGNVFYTGLSALDSCARTAAGSTRIESLSHVSQLECTSRIALALNEDGQVFSAAVPIAYSSGRSSKNDGFKQITVDSTGATLPKIASVCTSLDTGALLSTAGELFMFGVCPGLFPVSLQLPTKIELSLEPGDKIKKLVADRVNFYVLTQKGNVFYLNTSSAAISGFDQIAQKLGQIKHVMTEHKSDFHKYAVLTNTQDQSFIKGNYTYPDERMERFSDWTPLAEAGLKNIFEYMRIVKDLIKKGDFVEFKSFIETVPKRFLPLFDEVYYLAGQEKFKEGKEGEAIELWLNTLAPDSPYFKKAAPIMLEFLYGGYLNEKASQDADKAFMAELHSQIGQCCVVLKDYKKLLAVKYPQFLLKDDIDSKTKLRIAELHLRFRKLKIGKVTEVVNLTDESQDFKDCVAFEKAKTTTASAHVVMTASGGAGAGAGVCGPSCRPGY